MYENSKFAKYEFDRKSRQVDRPLAPAESVTVGVARHEQGEVEVVDNRRILGDEGQADGEQRRAEEGDIERQLLPAARTPGTQRGNDEEPR